jgi:hypothetical protein
MLWILIQWGPWICIRIRILIRNSDPDPQIIGNIAKKKVYTRQGSIIQLPVLWIRPDSLGSPDPDTDPGKVYTDTRQASVIQLPVLWIRIRIQWGPLIRIRIQDGKNDPQKYCK